MNAIQSKRFEELKAKSFPKFQPELLIHLLEMDSKLNPIVQLSAARCLRV